MRCTASAGVRTDPADWFLWQMVAAASPNTSNLLVETFAISAAEVPTASPRPPHRGQQDAERTGTATLQAIDAAL